MRTQPTPSLLAMRSSTVASRPTNAAAPVRIGGGRRRWRRASGRRVSSTSSDASRKTATASGTPTPARLTSAATSAPTANGARKNPPVCISPTPSTQPAPSQMIQASICSIIAPRGVAAVARSPGRIAMRPRRARTRTRGGLPKPRCRADVLRRLTLRLHECAREVLRIERAQILQRLADPDQLDGQGELARDRQGDPAAGRAVELGQHDAADLYRLGEHPRLAQAVLPASSVDGEQRLVRRALQLTRDHK